MLTSMKLVLFTTLAALSIAGAPGAATIEPGPSTSISAAPSPANFTVEERRACCTNVKKISATAEPAVSAAADPPCPA